MCCLREVCSCGCCFYCFRVIISYFPFCVAFCLVKFAGGTGVCTHPCCYCSRSLWDSGFLTLSSFLSLNPPTTVGKGLITKHTSYCHVPLIPALPSPTSKVKSFGLKGYKIQWDTLPTIESRERDADFIKVCP